jgi:hypothetical protein
MMPDKQINTSGNHMPKLSPRKEHLVKQISHHLQDATEPSFEDLVETIVALPESALQQFIEAIAARMVNTMSLHLFLDLVPTFSQNAAEEDIDREEVAEVLSDKDVLAGTQQLLDLHKRLAVHSLDELLRIEQITRGLQSLSNVTTAYDAERWLYQLSAVYQNKLKYEHLITD